MNATTEETLEPIVRLTRDLKAAAKTLSDDEARFLVDSFYMMQQGRIRAGNQVHALDKADEPEPHEVLTWYRDQSGMLERQVGRALDAYSGADPVGQWARSIKGIGPIISAGLIAHIDITRAATAGAIWRFAGLDPTVVWGKGEKRPWNASLKVLCWKIGQSFTKLKGHEDCFYGHLLEARWEQEKARNAEGQFSEQAEHTLANKKIKEKKTRARYEAGELPDGRILLRAQRYATKLFLAHYHDVAYREHFGTAPPKPYVIEHMGHTHYIPPPGG